MKEASKEILAMAKNLDVGSPEKSKQEPQEEQKVGGLFSSKAKEEVNPNKPSQDEMDARKQRLKAQREAMLKRK